MKSSPTAPIGARAWSFRHEATQSVQPESALPMQVGSLLDVDQLWTQHNMVASDGPYALISVTRSAHVSTSSLLEGSPPTERVFKEGTSAGFSVRTSVGVMKDQLTRMDSIAPARSFILISSEGMQMQPPVMSGVKSSCKNASKEQAANCSTLESASKPCFSHCDRTLVQKLRCSITMPLGVPVEC